MAFNLKFVTAPFALLGQAVEAAGTMGSSLVVIGEGLANKAHRYNDRVEAEDLLSDARAKLIREEEHRKLVLQQLADLKLDMNLAKEKAAAANVDEAVTARFVTKASLLTPEQLDSLASSGVNTRDVKAVRKYVMGTKEEPEDKPVDEEGTTEHASELSLYDQILAS